MAAPTLDALKIAFADEDTATWTAAARDIGARAVREAEARDFISYWLARSPGEAAAGEENIHRFRHACCALASYLSEAAADRDVFREALERHVRGPLVNLAFMGLKQSEGSVADLARIPGLAADFEGWRGTQRATLEARIDKLEQAGKAKGVEANRGKLEALGALDKASNVPSSFDPKLPGLLPHAPWALASYLSGVRALRALDGVPVDLITEGLLHLGAARRGAGLPFVLNLPGLLCALEGELEGSEHEALSAKVAQAHEPAWVAERLHYNEWVLEVARLEAADPVADRFARGLEVPAPLQEGLSKLAGATGRDGAREAARLMRHLVERLPEDDWAFEEQTHAERFALNVFAMLAVYGPAPLLGRHGGAQTPSVGHRVALVLSALQRCFRARDHVVPTLVRCLKLLLDQELRAAQGRANLPEVCRRQVALVRPLVAEWRLPRTLRKDLAIIVCRVLLAAYRHDRAVFVQQLYHVLYALPDEVLFREIIEYSTEPEVSELLRRTASVVEAAHDDAQGAALVVAYDHFAAGVGAVADGAEAVAWTARLPALVRFIGRAERSEGEDDRARLGPPPSDAEVEATLQAILRCQGELGAQWRDLAADRPTDKKGASWAARERAREEGQTARRVQDKFSRLLDDVQVLESDCLPEVGRPRPSDDLARRWRRLISTLDELNALVAESLPFLEREVAVALLEDRIEQLERRLTGLVRVLEREDESVAVAVLDRRVARTAEGDEGLAADLVNEDARLVQEWMLGRYMVRELAGTLRLRVLRALTTPWLVAAWVALPFLVCAGLHAQGLAAFEGLPFVAATAGNAALLVGYFVEANRPGAAGAGAGRYLLPQITAALFLGIMEVLAADEAWSLAVLEYEGVRLFTVLAFLAAGFFFIREVLLQDQLKGRGEARAKSRRAGSVMALILWQSFALVTLFGTLGGRVMGQRAGLELGGLGAAFGLPHEVMIGLGQVDFRIFPWALITWTVQVFFFSAIFERIMRGD